ncbi:MAG: hypothetical protein Q8938_14325 [Bacteroidota bacterium]|nr:hypothetical protein [Bacteroidota bacterium]
MELTRLEEHWNQFPEMSMEERPVLSTDLEKMALHNPFAPDFYLKTKLLARTYAGALLWLGALYQIKAARSTEGSDLVQPILGLMLLTYFLYFHIRLLFYADYRSLGSQPLIPFLEKIETIFDRYMHSYRIISPLAGLYLPVMYNLIAGLFRHEPHPLVAGGGFYRWLVIVFLSVSCYILFLHTRIGKYKKLYATVRSYRQNLILTNPQKAV